MNTQGTHPAELIYSEEQYAMMERLAEGVIYDRLTRDEKEMIMFLEQSGIAGARVDIAEGLYRLTQWGKTVLSVRKEKVRAEEAPI